jgi:thiamine phosphate synthase YjbQ (UPF0047 family)
MLMFQIWVVISSALNSDANYLKKATGTWQGIWYLEFRTSKHHRKVMATIQGEKA